MRAHFLFALLTTLSPSVSVLYCSLISWNAITRAIMWGGKFVFVVFLCAGDRRCCSIIVCLFLHLFICLLWVSSVNSNNNNNKSNNNMCTYAYRKRRFSNLYNSLDWQIANAVVFHRLLLLLFGFFLSSKPQKVNNAFLWVECEEIIFLYNMHEMWFRNQLTVSLDCHVIDKWKGEGGRDREVEMERERQIYAILSDDCSLSA